MQSYLHVQRIERSLQKLAKYQNININININNNVIESDKHLALPELCLLIDVKFTSKKVSKNLKQ
jgi:hypothetical protein